MIFFRNLSILLFVFLLVNKSFSQYEASGFDLKTWWQKDLELDSIPGIGLQRTYDEFLKNRLGKEVVVALLDTKIDLNHEDLKNQIWVNDDEIPDNHIDDDGNGFIDDVNGWNFLGNADGGEVPYQLLEIIRIIKKYESLYGNDTLNTKATTEVLDEYKKALLEVKKERSSLEDNIYYLDSVMVAYQGHKKELMPYLKQGEISEEILNILVKNGNLDEELADWMKSMIGWGIEEDGSFNNFIDEYQTELNTLLNSNFNDRENVLHGNNVLKDNSMPFQHSTLVCGVIASERDNYIGLSSFGNQIKVMPIVMVSYGDEYDEDVSRAIRYAVDNGADVINMSWGKYYSTQKQEVIKALKYAAENDVFLVTGAGNDALDNDILNRYPTDYINGKEVISNFITVGGITRNLDSTMVSYFSNYGKISVDLMAPASDIYTTEAGGGYKFSNGTSLATPMVAGTAALLKSYFPHLSAIQLKQIILDSVTKIDNLVVQPGIDTEPVLRTFSSLSKTGGILNVYKAFKLAESYSMK